MERPDTPSEQRESVHIRTLADLAKLAGVSTGTVSRALAGSDLVKTKTRDFIQALAREFDIDFLSLSYTRTAQVRARAACTHARPHASGGLALRRECARRT